MAAGPDSPWKQAELFESQAERRTWLHGKRVPALPLWIGELASRTGTRYEEAKVFLQAREEVEAEPSES